MKRHFGLLLFIDLFLVGVATLFAVMLRDNFELSTASLRSVLPYFAVTLLAATVALPLTGAHRSIWRFSAMADYLRVIAAIGVTVASAVGFGFLLNRLDGVARALPVVQALTMAYLLVGVRVAMRLRHARRTQIRVQRSDPAEETVVIVGLNTLTELFLRAAEELAEKRIEVAGIVGRNERHSGRLMRQYPVLGAPEEIEAVLKTLEIHGVFVDRIVVTSKFSSLSPKARQALLEISRTSDIVLDIFAERLKFDGHGAHAISRPDGASDPAEKLKQDKIEPKKHASRRAFYPVVKRTIDCAAAAALLILLSPLIALVGIVAAWDVGWPVVFWQRRPGMSGRHFKLYKFRTMRDAHDASGARVPDERRLSAVGSFLRRTRLDELPQLYNIVVGEMAFVGPRPLLPVDQSPEHAARLDVRPGLTGWAQVHGGRELSPHDKGLLDVWYVRNLSFWVDLMVIVRTAPMLLFGDGKSARERPRDTPSAGLQRVKTAGVEPGRVELRDMEDRTARGVRHASVPSRKQFVANA